MTTGFLVAGWVAAAGLAVTLAIFTRRAAATKGELKLCEAERDQKSAAFDTQVEENLSLGRRFNARIKQWESRVFELENVIAECDSPSARRSLVLGLLSKPQADDHPDD